MPFGYGHFPGGDPRKFRPDPECSTEEERAKWQEACARWDAGETAPKFAYEKGPHIPFSLPTGDGGIATGHVTLSGFGLGTYTYDDEDEPEDEGD